MNSLVWAEMSAEDQAVFADAATSAAKTERAESLGDIERVQRQAADVGIPTLVMSATERAKFALVTKSIYSKYDTFFDNGLLTRITTLH